MSTMQTDVKSAFADADGAVVPYRTRIKGLFVSVSTIGAAGVVYDNASSATGEVLLTIPALVVGQHTMVVPGEGILARNGVYLDINGVDAVVFFYG